jgi:hypothetical protein
LGFSIDEEGCSYRSSTCEVAKDKHVLRMPTVCLFRLY